MSAMGFVKWFLMGETTKQWQHFFMVVFFAALFFLAYFNPLNVYSPGARFWWCIFDAWAFGVQGTKFFDWQEKAGKL